MREYQPEGSTTTFDSMLSNGLTPSAAKEAARKLKADPDDLDSRLLLLGKDYRNRSSLVLRHLVWLIDNHPRHRVHQYMTLHTMTPAYRDARLSWLRQIRSNPVDVTVLYHAAIFCKVLAPKHAVTLLQRAADIDQFDDELPRELSHVFKLMAGRFSPEKNRELAHKAVEQLKIAVERYALGSNKDSYLLPYFCRELQDLAEIAFRFELIDDAADLGRLLLRHQSINSERFSSDIVGTGSGIYDLSTNLGYAILGRAALAGGKVELAKQHLADMMCVKINKFSDWTLAEELDELGEKDIVRKYLEYSLNGWEKCITDLENGQKNETCNDKLFALEMEVRLRSWLNRIQRNSNPRLPQ